jgi:hypothetical protein
MDNCSDLDRKISATKKLTSRSAKKRVVYFTKSDLETESDEDSDEAPKKRSFKKKANTKPDLLHLPGMSESAQLYTLCALAPVTNSLPWKKKSWPLQCQSSGKGNWVSVVKMGSKAATALTFEREVPCASLHKDEAKMHASEAAEVITPAPVRKCKTKRATNVVAPVVMVSVLLPDKVLATGGVPCMSPPMDDDNKDELEFGIVADLAIKNGRGARYDQLYN